MTTSSSDATALEDRLEKLEIRSAYQDQAVEDLNRTITDQWAQIESLTAQFKRLLDRLQQIEQGGGGEATDEPPPPHY